MMEKETEQLRIFGVQPVIEALEKNKEVYKVMLGTERNGPEINHIQKLCQERNIPVQRVPQVKLQKIVNGQNHQGVLAMIAAIEFQDLEDIILQRMEADDTRNGLFMLLDEVTDTRNFGAICRSAEAFGVDAIIIAAKGSAPVDMGAVKSSAGALLHIPICRFHNMVEAVDLLKAYQIPVYAVTEKGQTTPQETDLTTFVCLVMGAEGKGIQPKLRNMCTSEIRIPMSGQVSSLNVSNAAAIVLFESYRQRNT